MSLNEIPPAATLCPTDSRFVKAQSVATCAHVISLLIVKLNASFIRNRLRPDIRKLEEGDLEVASAEKQRIEDKQRKMLKNKPELIPSWFEKVGESWQLKEANYWTQPKTEISSVF